MRNIEDVLSEARHLRALGRVLTGPPTPQEDLVAHMLEPAAWSEHAEEHIRHARHYGIMGSSNHFGTMFSEMRVIAHVRAREIIEALERQAAGLPPLKRFDARRVRDDLEETLDVKGDYKKRFGVGPSVVNVGYLGCLDGLPMPDVAADGTEILLAWDGDAHRAIVRVHADHKVSGKMEPAPEGFEPWEASIFGKDLPGLVSRMISAAATGAGRMALQPA